MKARTQALCFEGFAVMHSGLTRTPLWSAEHLTRSRIDAAADLSRLDSFHPEPLLSTADRSELDDYKRSGYDRGHMSPNRDMATRSAQAESFSLANMVPQAPKINQNLWEGIESAVRSTVKRGDGLYIITGPLFEGNSVQQLNDRVLVPTAVFKAVYSPAEHWASAYIATNTKTSRTTQYDVVSIGELEQRVGIVLFPSMAESVRRTRVNLPNPEIHGHGGGGNSRKSSRSKSHSTWIVQ